MKHMRKAVSLLLALVMALGLVTTAGAAETVDNKTSHSYTAYQIFSGEHSEVDGETKLINVEWGDAMTTPYYGSSTAADCVKAVLLMYGSKKSTYESTKEDFDADNYAGLYDTLYLPENDGDDEDPHYRSVFQGCDYAREFADKLSSYSDNSDIAKAFARVVYASLFYSFEDISAVPHTDIPASATSAELDPGYYLIVDTSTIDTSMAKNLALLQVTGKGDITISSKTGAPTVQKYVREVDRTSYWMSGEWKKTADTSINAPVWFKLEGTMPDNYDNFLTYKYVFRDTLGKGLTVSTITDRKESFTVYVLNGETKTMLTKDTDYTLTIGEDNGKGQEITVAFANLKNIEEVTQDSKIVVEYCADLTPSAEIGRPGNKNEVYLEYSSDPNFDGYGTEPTSTTKKDVVRVFTYELDLTKIDGNDANTRLSGVKFALYYEYTGENNTTTAGKWWVTPASSGSYPCTQGAIKYKGEDDPTFVDSDLWVTDEDGTLDITGLDAGTYYLREVTAPAGYNTLDEDIKIVIGRTLLDDNAANENGDALTALSIAVGSNDATDGVLGTGVVSMTVENLKGATLPETGGIGTTLFYVIGGVLVAGAAVVLITRKRVRDGQ